MYKHCDDRQLISYEDALARIRETAGVHQSRRQYHDIDEHETLIIHPQVCEVEPKDEHDVCISTFDAVGSRSVQTIVAPHATPKTDTSAMDGFAVCSEDTLGASPTHTVRLRVVDCIAAGDAPETKAQYSDHKAMGSGICAEIMTGACFPEINHPYLDAVVKVENVVDAEDWPEGEIMVSRYIQISAPVKPRQHRRPAGSDFAEGECIVETMQVIQPKHVAALASVGIHKIQASSPLLQKQENTAEGKRNVRIGILSTGAEVVDLRQGGRPPHYKLPDSNGPYLMTSLKQAYPSADLVYLGVADDNEDGLLERLSAAITDFSIDVIITSGGVSRGRYDLVRYVVESRLKGKVVFHGVRIRPGAPVLFATLASNGTTINKYPLDERQIAFFGVPGNPVAAAAALHFFVMPYLDTLQTLHSARQEAHIRTVDFEENIEIRNQPMIARRNKPKDVTSFWLARHVRAPYNNDSAQPLIHVLKDQASYKSRNLLRADCWVKIPAGQDGVNVGQKVLSYSL